MHRLRKEISRPWIDFCRNLIEAGAQPRSIISDYFILKRNSSRIREVARSIDTNENLNFVFLYPKDTPLSYLAFCAIASAQRHNPAYNTILYCFHEPTGAFWDRIKDSVRLVLLQDFQFFGIARIHHGAHKADVVRLMALAEVGGVYLDLDTITLQPFSTLPDAQVVLGFQAHTKVSRGGICNGVIKADRNARFIRTWLRQYAWFRSRGRGHNWARHSVKLPFRLYLDAGPEVHVVPFDYFHYPLWMSTDRLFAEGSANIACYMKPARTIHLWSQFLNPKPQSFADLHRSSFIASVVAELEP